MYTYVRQSIGLPSLRMNCPLACVSWLEHDSLTSFEALSLAFWTPLRRLPAGS